MNFTYEEQIEWNRLRELYVYVNNIRDIDSGVLEFANTMVRGVVSMMHEGNKTKTLAFLNDILEVLKKRHVQYEEDM